MIDLVNPDLLTCARISHFIRLIPEEMRSPAIGITVFCLVYLMGSMITPLACQFLNDSDMLGKILPTEEKIQASTYENMGVPAPTDQAVPAKIRLVSLGSSPGSGLSTGLNAPFLHDEGALLLRGSRQLRETEPFARATDGIAWCHFQRVRADGPVRFRLVRTLRKERRCGRCQGH
jgi:hypothetical protein